MKISVLLLIITNAAWSVAFVHTQVLIHLRVADDVVKTNEIKVTISNSADTISRLEFKEVRSGTKSETSVINKVGEYSLAFEYLIKRKWKRIDYAFAFDGREKRIEIYLDFDRNDRGHEYLQDLTVSKIYTSSNLSIVPVWGLKR